EARAEAQYRALLAQARERLRLTTQGRYVETMKILESIAKPRSKVHPGKLESLDLEAKSLYAAALGVPDVIVQDANRVELPSACHHIWWPALHPNGQPMAMGPHLGPIRWQRGQPPQLPTGLESERRRPRVAFSPDGKYLVFAPAAGGVELWDGNVSPIE